MSHPRPSQDIADAILGLAALRLPEDRHGAFPSDAITIVRDLGLLAAPLSVALGGAGLCDPAGIDSLRAVLVAVGRASLVLGRLYEGHVNALALVERYGSPETRARFADDAHTGHLFGVWNTEPDPGGLALVETAGARSLSGAKNYASGAGFVTRPLVTARLEDGRRLMLIVPLQAGQRADLSAWRAHGMRATATGTLDFEGLTVGREDIIGEPDDYLRQPAFSCGAWRFLAVQCGGIEAVFEAHRAHLKNTGRGRDPHQLARLGQAATAVETARLFVARAARVAARADGAPAMSIAYVNLARGAVERAGLDVIQLAQRSVGLAGFLEEHPLERLMRDLATYLRQPAPDYALAGAATHLLDSPDPLPDMWPDL